MSKNDDAWQQLFQKYQIISNVRIDGFFRISAANINEFREARLMTKFDHRSNLPSLFMENNLSILPVSRGDYIIAPMHLYQEIEESGDSEIRYFNIPDHLQSLNLDISSEAKAINSAFVSGILSDFLDEDGLFPTVSGRMRSGCFNFKVLNSGNTGCIDIDVANSQIEIDGGFEGFGSLALIEAKNSLSSDFLIRQLYYPYRLWIDKIGKPVRPVFMIYANGLFYLYEYRFEDVNCYNSVSLVKSCRYSLEDRDVSAEEIESLLAQIQPASEPSVPFPQADSFERIVNLCELLLEKRLTKEDITSAYDFDGRQANYYTDAGRYLGLISKDPSGDINYELTLLGRSTLELGYKERQLKYAELILRHRVFSESLRLCLNRAETPTVPEIVRIMKDCKLYNIHSESTYKRRASTILSWIDWIIELQH